MIVKSIGHGGYCHIVNAYLNRRDKVCLFISNNHYNIYKLRCSEVIDSLGGLDFNRRLEQEMINYA